MVIEKQDNIQMINDGKYGFGDPTVMWLRMPPDSWVTVTKGGVVDKSEALAPTYPPMRNSDLRSSR